MKKLVVFVTFIILIFISYNTYMNINRYHKNSNIRKDEIINLKNDISKLDTDIKDMKNKTDKIVIDDVKKGILEVWEKELQKVKNL